MIFKSLSIPTKAADECLKLICAQKERYESQNPFRNLVRIILEAVLVKYGSHNNSKKTLTTHHYRNEKGDGGVRAILDKLEKSHPPVKTMIEEILKEFDEKLVVSKYIDAFEQLL